MQVSETRTQVYWVWEQATPKGASGDALTDACPSETAFFTDHKRNPSVRQALDLFLCQGFRMAYSSAPRVWAVLGRWLM